MSGSFEFHEEPVSFRIKSIPVAQDQRFPVERRKSWKEGFYGDTHRKMKRCRIESTENFSWNENNGGCCSRRVVSERKTIEMIDTTRVPSCTVLRPRVPYRYPMFRSFPAFRFRLHLSYVIVRKRVAKKRGTGRRIREIRSDNVTYGRFKVILLHSDNIFTDIPSFGRNRARKWRSDSSARYLGWSGEKFERNQSDDRFRKIFFFYSIFPSVVSTKTSRFLFPFHLVLTCLCTVKHESTVLAWRLI